MYSFSLSGSTVAIFLCGLFQVFGDSPEHGDCRIYIDIILKYQSTISLHLFDRPDLIHLPTLRSSSCYIYMNRDYSYLNHSEFCIHSGGRLAWLYDYKMAKSLLIDNEMFTESGDFYTALRKNQSYTNGTEGYYLFDLPGKPYLPMLLTNHVTKRHFAAVNFNQMNRISDQLALFGDPTSYPKYKTHDYFPIMFFMKKTTAISSKYYIFVGYGEDKTAQSICEYQYLGKRIELSPGFDDSSDPCRREVPLVIAISMFLLLDVQLLWYLKSIMKLPDLMDIIKGEEEDWMED